MYILVVDLFSEAVEHIDLVTYSILASRVSYSFLQVDPKIYYLFGSIFVSVFNNSYIYQSETSDE